jgi:hypothetical protein
MAHGSLFVTAPAWGLGVESSNLSAPTCFLHMQLQRHIGLHRYAAIQSQHHQFMVSDRY